MSKVIVATDPNNVPVTFVNSVDGIGFLNGVVNVTMSTYRYTPLEDDMVKADSVIAARLRFDLFCAQQLHKLLGDIIETNTKGAAQPQGKLDS